MYTTASPTNGPLAPLAAWGMWMCPTNGGEEETGSSAVKSWAREWGIRIGKKAGSEKSGYRVRVQNGTENTQKRGIVRGKWNRVEGWNKNQVCIGVLERGHPEEQFDETSKKNGWNPKVNDSMYGRGSEQCSGGSASAADRSGASVGVACGQRNTTKDGQRGREEVQDKSRRRECRGWRGEHTNTATTATPYTAPPLPQAHENQNAPHPTFSLPDVFALAYRPPPMRQSRAATDIHTTRSEHHVRVLCGIFTLLPRCVQPRAMMLRPPNVPPSLTRPRRTRCERRYRAVAPPHDTRHNPPPLTEIRRKGPIGVWCSPCSDLAPASLPLHANLVVVATVC